MRRDKGDKVARAFHPNVLVLSHETEVSAPQEVSTLQVYELKLIFQRTYAFIPLNMFESKGT